MNSQLAPDPERLYSAARFHAHAAMSLADGDVSEHASLDLATRCGSVVELLAKAFLATCDVRLLSKSEAHHHLLDLLLQARGKTLPTPPAAASSKPTVDATVAVRLAARADQRLTDTTARADRILRARNSAVHMAIAPNVGQLSALLDDMAVVATSMIAVLSKSPADFWADHHPAALARVEQSTAEIRTAAERKVDKAKEALGRLHRQIGDEVWAGVLAALRQRPARTGDLEDTMPCPACAEDAQVSWSAEVDGDWSDGEIVMYSYWALDGLACPVCGLELDGEELEALDLDDVPDPTEAAEAMSEDVDDWREYVD